jgi:flagellar hook-length control protein FliK
VQEALREAPGTDNGRMLIRLKPAELGEVHVDLTMANGKLSARLVTSQTEVRDAFVRDLHAFKAGLEAQGVVVRDISVAVRAGVADQQQQQQAQQQAPQDWWRELPIRPEAALPSLPANAGYAGADALDQRFSALA